MFSSSRIFLPAGSTLFQQGETGSTAYLIVTGCVRLHRRRGAVQVGQGERKAGEIVGEMALVEATSRSDSAVVVEDCELIELTREAVAKRVADMDPVLRLCLGVMLDRIRPAAARSQRTGNAGDAPDRNPSWSHHLASARDALAQDHQLRHAVGREELLLHFQPVVRLATRTLVGFEVLLRWHHPERGLLQPAEFIPFAESAGLVGELTDYCLGRLGLAAASLGQAASANGAVERLWFSVNLSASDLHRPDFGATAANLLRQGGADPRQVKLEVTESVLMRDPGHCARVLEACRAEGMLIAMDDFGTGYSSLYTLNTLPVDVLKTDRSFVASMEAGGNGRKIIGAIVNLAAELDLPVVAEGIETEQQARMLSDMGCDFGQGYLYGQPQPLPDAVKLVRAWRAAAPAEQVGLRA